MESFLNYFALKIISLDILQNAAIYLNILLHTWQLLLEMMRLNQIWPQDKSNLNQINEVIFMRCFWFTIPSEIIWSWIIANIKQLLKKRQFDWKNCLHSLEFRRQKDLKYKQNFGQSLSFLEVCRPGQERCAIAIAHTHTSHIKNTRVKRGTSRKL